MSPRHPADPHLRAYLDDRDEQDEPSSLELARRDLRRSVDSTPPPPELYSARQRLIERVGTDTGNYDIRALERQMQKLVEGTAAQKIAEEHDMRLIAEARLATLESDRRKFWYNTLSGVLVGLIVAGTIWVTTVLVARPGH